MNLRRIDLNLLVAFDALMAERNVTRAARRVGIGQPAMSAALGRLRALFKDELLVRAKGAGGAGFAPTARSAALEPQVRRLLQEISSVVSEPPEFVPAASTRRFRIRLSDLVAEVLLPQLVRRFAAAAPEASLEIVHLTPENTLDALDRDDIALAISTGLLSHGGIATHRLSSDRLMGLVRQGHPMVERIGSFEGFMDCQHVRVSQSPLDDRFVERQLAERGYRRRVALTVPHWLVVPPVVMATDLLAVIPESVGQRFAARPGLACFLPPLPQRGFDWMLYWHRRHEADPGHCWLRALICDAARDAAGTAAERGL